MLEPIADRPDMPEGYLGAAPLPWKWAEEQLVDARSYWITTIGASGRPHVRPVWGVWLGVRLVRARHRVGRHALRGDIDAVAIPDLTRPPYRGRSSARRC